jgi:Ca2+-binding RTX toxin-like protein
VAGSANDTIIAGAGQETIVGGAGSDLMAFVKTVITGTHPSDSISNFTASDSVYLYGYGASAAGAATTGAVTSGGNTTITLSDNTKITFVGVSSASALSGHIFST